MGSADLAKLLGISEKPNYRISIDEEERTHFFFTRQKILHGQHKASLLAGLLSYDNALYKVKYKRRQKSNVL